MLYSPVLNLEYLHNLDLQLVQFKLSRANNYWHNFAIGKIPIHSLCTLHVIPMHSSDWLDITKFLFRVCVCVYYLCDGF